MIGRFGILLVVCVYCVKGQVHRKSDGPCKPTPVNENFKIEEYLGTWFDAQRYPGLSSSDNPYKGKCLKGNYEAGPHPGLVLGKLQYKTLNSTDTDEMIFIESFIKHQHNKFAYVLRGAPADSVDFYAVLDTDYKNWSVEYQCWNDSKDEESRYELVWILTRSSSPTDEVTGNALKALQGLNVSTSELSKTDQSCYSSSSEK